MSGTEDLAVGGKVAGLSWRRIVLFGVIAVALIGLFDAFANLPVVSGCADHGFCPSEHPATSPDAPIGGEAG